MTFFMAARLLSVVLVDRGRITEAVTFFAESETVAGAEDESSAGSARPRRPTDVTPTPRAPWSG
ncbi:hypothetical protein [Streptomyces sp. NPDC101455]|uniref:hypothetical protein n=1 Tax=Streptomyces sp. NPDC101455 TaxID=3366142 RepID=UPI003818070F